MDGTRSVLIVDRSEETREVLQTALERRGVRTLTAGRTEAGLELVRQHHPDLIVLDLELNESSSVAGVTPAFLATEETSTEDYCPRLVLLGNLRGWRDRIPGGEFVRKPYHYGPLIRKIEELLATMDGICTANRSGPTTGSPKHEPETVAGRRRIQAKVKKTSAGSFGPCQRCSSSAAPIKAAVSN